MVNKDTVTSASVALIALCAVVLTAVNVQKTMTLRAPSDPVRSVSDWRSYASVGHRTGPAESKVTIVMFSDYECPACKASAPQIAAIREKHPSDVAVVVRHYPLPGHPKARPAAEAAVCAAEQGRFTQFDHLLFARTEELGKRSWSEMAAEAGASDTAAFEACMKSGRAAALVEADVAAGNRLGVPGTPTLLVNDELYTSLSGIEKAIDRHLAGGGGGIAAWLGFGS